MTTKKSPYEDFARRLHKAFDNTFIRPGRNRVTEVANQFGVSRETARLWFAGAAMPELSRLMEVADFCTVSLDWLARGEDPARAEASVGDESGRYDVPLSEEERHVISALRAMNPRRRRGLITFLGN